MENLKTAEDDIHFKSMKLYFNPNRIYKQLENAGFTGSKLTVEQVSKFDNYHYYGTKAVDDCIEKLQINRTFQVLDFGSGIGGPARHLASKSRCRVKAVEIQEDLNKIAADLTNRCGLSDRIDHVRQDIYKLDTDSNYFDCAVSWLAVNHIEDKAGLFEKLFTMLKKGGKIYIEDFYQKGPVTENEREILFIDDLPTIEEYRKYLVDAGFINIEILNVTSSWIKFVTNRAEVFANERAQNCASFGEETVNSLQDFYDGMKSLYDTNTIGGVQIYAQSPNN